MRRFENIISNDGNAKRKREKRKKKEKYLSFFPVGYTLRDAWKSRLYRRFDLATKY